MRTMRLTADCVLLALVLLLLYEEHESGFFTHASQCNCALLERVNLLAILVSSGSLILPLLVAYCIQKEGFVFLKSSKLFT